MSTPSGPPGKARREPAPLAFAVGDTAGLPAAVFLKDEFGRYVMTNATTARFLGCRVDEVLGATDVDLFEPAACQTVLHHDRAVLLGGAHESLERLYGGHVGRLIHVRKSPVCDESGRVVGVLGVATDVTGTPLGPSLSDDTEAAFRLMFETNPEAMFVYDTENLRILDVNQAALERYGYSRDEFLGLTLADLRPPEQLAALRDCLDRTKGLDRVDCGVWTHRTRGGECLEVAVAVSRFPHADRPAQLVLARDLTGQRRAERALCDSEVRYRLVAENSSDLVVQLDASGKVLYASPASLEVLGLDSERLVGASVYDLVHPDDRASASAAFQAMLSGTAPVALELRAYRPDGRAVWLGVRGRTVGRDARVIVCSVRDVTSRRMAEQAERASEELARSVLNALSARVAVIDADGSLVAANREWRQLASGLGRGPLGADTEGPPALVGVPGSARARLAGAVQAVLAGQEPMAEVDYDWVCDGRRRWFRARVSAFGPPECRRAVVTHDEVTELALAGRELRAYADRLANLRAIDQAILGARSPGDIAASVLGLLARVVEFSRGGVVLINQDTGEAHTIAVSGEAPAAGRRGAWPLVRLGRSILQSLGDGRPFAAVELLPADRSHPALEDLCGGQVRSFAALPFMGAGKLIGLLYLGSDRPGAFDADTVDLAREVADQVAVAVRHAQVFEEELTGRERLRSLSVRLIRAQEEERRHIARELHDEIGQGLTAAKVTIQTVMQGLPDAARVRLREAVALVDTTLGQVRSMSLNLRPSILDDLGLVPALRSHVQALRLRSGLDAVFQGEVSGRFDPDLETACYRVAQEALTNVIRHARATRVRVTLEVGDAGLCMTVSDDGRGFDLEDAMARANAGESLGVVGMRERAHLAGGRLTIETAPGRGTAVRLRFPTA